MPSPATILKSISSDYSGDTGFDIDTGYSVLTTEVKKYIDTLECYYCNLPHDVQSLLDDWIREWKHQTDYLIARHYV